jgi:hypothetical protein
MYITLPSTIHVAMPFHTEFGVGWVARLDVLLTARVTLTLRAEDVRILMLLGKWEGFEGEVRERTFSH